MQPALPLRVSSSFVVLIADWSSFAYVTQAPERLAMATLLASLATVALVLALEPAHDRDAFAPRSVRALIAGVAVAIPLPLYGTLVAVALIAGSWLRPRRGAR